PWTNRSPSTSSFSLGIDSSRGPSSKVPFHGSAPERVVEATYFGKPLTMSAHLPVWSGQYPASPSKVLRPSRSPPDLACRSNEYTPCPPSGRTHSPTGSMTPSMVAWVVAITRPISILLHPRELPSSPLYPDDERGDGKKTGVDRISPGSGAPWPRGRPRPARRGALPCSGHSARAVRRRRVAVRASR